MCREIFLFCIDSLLSKIDVHSFYYTFFTIAQSIAEVAHLFEILTEWDTPVI